MDPKTLYAPLPPAPSKVLREDNVKLASGTGSLDRIFLRHVRFLPWAGDFRHVFPSPPRASFYANFLSIIWALYISFPNSESIRFRNHPRSWVPSLPMCFLAPVLVETLRQREQSPLSQAERRLLPRRDSPVSSNTQPGLFRNATVSFLSLSLFYVDTAERTPRS